MEFVSIDYAYGRHSFLRHLSDRTCTFFSLYSRYTVYPLPEKRFGRFNFIVFLSFLVYLLSYDRLTSCVIVANHKIFPFSLYFYNLYTNSSTPPTGRMDNTLQLPSPNTRSISCRYPSASASGTNA